MIRCAIVDDEPLAREGLADYVAEIDFLHLVGVCKHPVELMNLMEREPVDLIYLDIQMPKLSGIDFLEMTPHPPLVIMTTAYPSYALEGFRLNVLDFLLKPITFDRFIRASQKAKDHARLLAREGAQHAPEPDYFFIKCENKYEKIYFRDILYIQGMQNYVQIFTEQGMYLTLLNLKDIEQNLTGQPFIRVHKSYIVSIPKVDSLETADIVVRSHRIPVSRNYRDQVLKQVVGNKLWRR
ncbi:DNA-binding response regulator, LytR/AlgR family [Catalinimonas alkaloidigena]|uniref:DNA-binding response regulator, LytR/AlgR family n=1 Tax=Catalinimonas alkaloidigena TaxID=1075417 RepID=A0A1G9KPL9_9BACT|nr:LytTR family DNA-binding domain-containing protein [Catalinimonas alkaloidigena]SDL51526.1 DNA-binding response regulator, LytR/AlgR family [Catalinimonas alkaloidigena]